MIYVLGIDATCHRGNDTGFEWDWFNYNRVIEVVCDYNDDKYTLIVIDRILIVLWRMRHEYSFYYLKIKFFNKIQIEIYLMFRLIKYIV